MSINRGMDKEDMVHIYNGMLLMKKNEIMPFVATWMEVEIVEWSKSDRERRNIILHPLNAESKKKW